MKNKIVYHGSRGGIVGNIEPISRVRCDFGKGFYMGNQPEQAKSLVYSDNRPMFYTMRLKLSEIPDKKILIVNDLQWANFVLYNRGRLENVKYTKFYDEISSLGKDKDIIIGPIADDNMNIIMKQFVNGEITDKVMLECIRCIDYGVQYVAKTEYACSKIEICSEEELDASKYSEYQKYSNIKRRESEEKVKEIKKQFRNQGKYIDEIFEDYKDLDKIKKRESDSLTSGISGLDIIAKEIEENIETRQNGFSASEMDVFDDSQKENIDMEQNEADSLDDMDLDL